MNYSYEFFPQHLLNLRPLPQMHVSLLPIFSESRVIGVFEGQQVVSLQQDPLSSGISLGNLSLLSIIFLPSWQHSTKLIVESSDRLHIGFAKKSLEDQKNKIVRFNN